MTSYVNDDLIVTGNVAVQGKTELSSNYIYMNNGYTTAVAQTGGLSFNYSPTGLTDTVNGVYVAGVASTSNPTVVTTGSATFAAGDFVQFNGASKNNGLFEVLTHTTTTLTIRGIGTTAAIEDFTDTQFIAGSSDSATIAKVNVAIIRTGIDGVFETARGSSTTGSGLVFKDVFPNQLDTLAYSATVDLDMDPLGLSYKTVTLTGNITFTTSSRGAGRITVIRIVGDTSDRTLTFPAGWKFLGGPTPASIPANQVGILSITGFGTADADIVAGFSFDTSETSLGGSGTVNELAYFTDPDSLTSSSALTWDGIDLGVDGYISITEEDSPPTPTSGTGYIFAKTDGILYWKDDSGTETSVVGFGDVVKVGTPANNQLGIWTGDGTIEGDSNFTWTGTVLDMKTTSNAGTYFTNTAASGSTGGSGIISGSNDGAAMANNDRLGYLVFRGARDASSTFTNSAAVAAYASETWTGSSSPSRLIFQTTPSGSNSRVEGMRLDKNGNIGVGQSTITSKLEVGGTFAPAVSAIGSVVSIGGTLTEAASGTHALLAGLEINIPVITGGSATVTNTASLYVAGVASATVTGDNYAMWIDAGTSRFDGSLLLAEAAAPGTPASGFGSLYAKTDGYLYWKNDAAEEYNVSTSAGGGGGGSLTGSGATNQITYWNGTTSLTGSSSFTFDGTTFAVDTAAIFNETGAAIDFRIEGDNEQNLFFVDGSTDRIGIGTNTPAERLHIEGTVDGGVKLRIHNLNDGGTSHQSRLDVVAGPTMSVGGSGDPYFSFIVLGDGHASVPSIVNSVATNCNEYRMSTSYKSGGKITFYTDPGTAGATIERIAITASTETVFNDPGSDYDFRVEGDTRANLLFIDAGQDRVGINRTTGNLGATLDIDNLAVAESVFIARDNGTAKFTIANGGALTQEGGAVFNETGADVDFRVEGLTDPNLLTVNAGVNAIGIGQSTPTSKLEIGGTFAPAASAIGSMFSIGGTLTEAGSGTHGLLAGLEVNAPTVTGAAATVTNTASLYVAGAMSATVAGVNYGLWVDGGETRLDGSVLHLGDNDYQIETTAVSTTNATVTTIMTLGTSSNTTYMLKTEIVGKRTGGASGAANDGAVYVRSARIKNNAGTVTINDLQTDFTSEDQDWDGTITFSGTNVLVRVTGAASNNIDWVATTTVQAV